MKLLILFLICLPLFTKAQTNCVKLEHNGYITYFDTILKYPKLVEWCDTKERCGCSQIPRKDQFAPDPILKKYTDLQKSYELANRTEKEKNHKGFDRGHMSPAADNKCPLTKNGKVIPAETLLLECFYFSNMTPQYHSLNAGDWKKLEERTRLLAIEQDSVYVWCGSTGNLMSYGSMTIPDKCWKIIYITKTKTFESYIFNNSTDKPIGLDKCKVTKEEIEKLTGLTFN
jgi:endonuclease G